MIASPIAATQLAQWIALNEPKLFQALSENAARGAGFAGFTDWLSTVGSSLSGAVKSVGTFLTSEKGLSTLTTLGGAYLANKSQQNVLQTQVALAQAGMAPAPITNSNFSGGVQPVYTPTGQPVTPALLNQLQPTFLQRYGVAIGLGVAAFGALLLLRSR